MVLPSLRSGHSSTVFKDYLMIFGGIHEIAKELNDAVLFDIKNKKWINFFDTPYDGFQSNLGSPSKTHLSQMSPLRRQTLRDNSPNKISDSISKAGRSQATSSPVKQPKTPGLMGPTSPTKKNKSEEVVDVKLESPRSLQMKNSFLIKTHNPTFDTYWGLLRKKK